MYKIVNLETFDIPPDQKYDLLKSEIGNSKHILGLMLADGFIHENPGELIYKLSDEIDLYIVSGLASYNTNYKKVISFNFNLHTTYQSYKNKETSKWNSDADKFLFLGGVPSRPNRIGLLNKFYKSDLIKNSIWTFFPPWTEQQKQWCQNYLNSDYKEIINLERKIDDIYESSKHYGTNPSPNLWTKDTAWIDPNIFYNTLLSIVSEGIDESDLSSKYLTEKTYRVFVQRHPFLHASNPEMFDYIKELGFKTFEEYMIVKDYAYLLKEEDRLDAIVENTKYFLKTYSHNREKILKDVEHNYQHFFKLVSENFKVLNKIKQDFKITEEEIDKWFNQKGFGHLVRSYAN